MRKAAKTILKVVLAGIAVILAAVAFKYGSLAVTKQFYPKKYSKEISAASEKYGIDQDLIYAVMRTESRFRPDAVSSKGAVGLMQLTPETFAWISFLKGESRGAEDINITSVNIDYGVFLLKYLYDNYRDFDTALAAYNAGMGRVNGWLAENGGKLPEIPIKETADFVKTVNNTAAFYKKLYNVR